MATIKGQNLRIFIDQSPVARAQSCTLHIAANVQDISSKDSTNGWQENLVTGFTWDISVDALILPNASAVVTGGDGTSARGTTEAEYGNDQTTMYMAQDQIVIPPNESLSVRSDVATETVYIIGVTDDDIIAQGTHNASYMNSSSSGKSVLIGISTEDEDMTYGFGDIGGTTAEDSIDSLLSGTDVEVSLDVTSGTMNRTSSDVVLSGYARITDISVNATDRQLSTYTCQMTGTGELSTT